MIQSWGKESKVEIYLDKHDKQKVDKIYYYPDVNAESPMYSYLKLDDENELDFFNRVYNALKKEWGIVK
jgi:hypothetical protein